MTTTYFTRSDVQGTASSLRDSNLASNAEEFTRDTPVSLAPLTPEEALRGLLMTREVQNNPEEIAALKRAQAQSERGEGRWLDEDETDEDEGN